MFPPLDYGPMYELFPRLLENVMPATVVYVPSPERGFDFGALVNAVSVLVTGIIGVVAVKETRRASKEANLNATRLVSQEIDSRRNDDESRQKAILEAVVIEARTALYYGLRYHGNLIEESSLPVATAYELPLSNRITEHAGMLSGQIVQQVAEMARMSRTMERALRLHAKRQIEAGYPLKPTSDTARWIWGTSLHAYRVLQMLRDLEPKFRGKDVHALMNETSKGELGESLKSKIYPDIG